MEEQLVVRYLSGLSQSIQDMLCLHIYEQFWRYIKGILRLRNNRLLGKLARVSKHINIIKEDLTIIKGQPPFKSNLLNKLNKHVRVQVRVLVQLFEFVVTNIANQGIGLICSKPESQSGKNLMIEEPTCDVANSIYDDSNNSGEILCEDGGANLVI